MDKGDFLRRDALGDELGTDVLVHAHLHADALGVLGCLLRLPILLFRLGLQLRGLALGGGQVAEHQLRTPIVGTLLPNLEHIVDAGIDLAVRVVRQQRIHQPLVQGQLAAVIGNF